jgi:hypothetical protein
LDQQ